MRRLLATLAIAATTTTPASAAQGTPGPFPGVLRTGETRIHAFDNDPANMGCPAVMTTYTVRLTYAPPADVLTLSVGSFAVASSGGRASLTFAASWCTAFDVRVSGTSIRTVAGYVVDVVRGSPA